ncbi:MAG TPA: hypothetical protein PLV61_05955 [Parvularculaceae bacterium]|nr:hypothetical protein [Parvularculaceae bacterium]
MLLPAILHSRNDLGDEPDAAPMIGVDETVQLRKFERRKCAKDAPQLSVTIPDPFAFKAANGS